MAFLLRLTMMIGLMAIASHAFADGYCRKLAHKGDDYTVCAVDPRKSKIRIHDLDRHGKPYMSFQALSKALWADRIFLRLAMNGGMYQPDFSAVGLYVENGVQKQKINLNAGWGNFHLLPNGVFFLQAGKGGVLESKAYTASGIRPDFATQSGPMLVIDGKIHPRFNPLSDSLKKRNGVGIAADGQLIFAISEGEVRFHDFATLFRDALGCRNALFLDGTISALHVPEWRRSDASYPLGPIISVEITIPPG
ncbi:MAG: hypothetical protein JWM58_1200 [Rhizobium sp.]|nr:hypothetical protein [Rhizobium sp.]